LKDHYAPILLAVFILTFTSVFGWLAVRRHELMLTHAFDMGQMIQALWTIRHLDGNFSTITGLPFLGDHARFILYPLGMIGLPARALLVFQAGSMALGAVPVYLLARRRGAPWAALFVATLYLLYPSLQWTVLFDLHPEILATPLLLLAFWAVDSGRRKTYAIAIAIALLCREDVSVAVALIGALLILERRWRIGVATVGVGVVAFVVGSVVMDYANPAGMSVLDSRFGYLGHAPTDILQNVFLHPATTFAGMALGLSAALMLLGFVAPIALVFAARWTRLAAVFPLLLINLLSSSPVQRTIYFHYGFLITVFIFIAAADGAGRLSQWRGARRFVGFGSVLAIAAVALPFTSPFGDVGYRGGQVWARPASISRQLALTFPEGFQADARAALALVGDGTVSASPNLLPQLAERKEVYMFPNPFYRVWYGDYLTRNPGPEIRPTIPADPPRWVALDLIHGGPDSVEVRAELVALLPTAYKLVYSGQFVQLWEIK
jgi:uncharacterized membrane protein